MASEPSPGPLKELATSRARFIAELGERITNIRQGLARMSSSSDPAGELNAVRRRLHALAAAADVLHFTAAADAIGRAETELSNAAAAPSPAPARERVSRILDLAPSLALGAAIDLQEELDAEPAHGAREPLCVLIFGDAALAAAFNKPGPLHGAEAHVARDVDELLTLLTRLGPDVLLLDGDDAALVDVLPRLRQAATGHALPLVAVGNFESYEGMLRLVRRGVARVLPKPVDAAALQRTIHKLAPRELVPLVHSNPFAEGANLVEVVAAEARRAFADPHSGAPPAAGFDADASKHALTALWSAFARIRALAGRSPDGTSRLPFEGPYGMIPLAPTLAAARSNTAAAVPSAVTEALAGRRFVVADSDATLLGALSRSLQRLGASVLPARDGAHALELAERQWPDALITDTDLPNLDGLSLCKRLRDDVALSDVPVALICWKEDLLEHARRLSEQHGGDPRPLDPESFAPLAGALGKRIALERRLERHDAVHGRLDGLTPRLLLQLCCSRTPSSLLRVQSGRLTAEVAVVDGRPSHARLLDAGAIAVEGPGALGPFLGMRVGRFSVELLTAALPAHFSGDVMTVLAPAVARARRAHAWLHGAGVSALSRVDLEPRVAALYLDEAPAGHKVLLARLARGESLRLLIESPEIDRAALTSVLVELARRGAVLALIDTEGRDALAPDTSRPASSGRGPRFRDAPAPVMPAAMTLAEAVLQAVSGPGEPNKPSARRTHPGLAPPAPPVPHSPRRASATPPPDPSPAADNESDASSDEAPGAAESTATEAAQQAHDQAALDQHDDRAEAEPDTTDLDDDVAPPFSTAARVRAVMSPVLVTLAAAGLAFAGMRVIMGGGLERLGVAPSTLMPASGIDDDGSRSLPARLPAPPQPPAPQLLPLSAADASADLDSPEAAAETPAPSEVAIADGAAQPAQPAPADGATSAADPAQPGVPPDVDVSTELLDPLPEPKLRAGHGMLEVNTWQPQRIYVDGVFVGNYERRLIPLAPGTYQLRLVAADRDIEQPVPIEAGRRTRVSLRLESK